MYIVTCRDKPPLYPSSDPDDRPCPTLDRIIPENAEVRFAQDLLDY